MQKHEHDDRHQNHGVAQRFENFVDRFLDEGRGVVNDCVIDAFRETIFQFVHLGADLMGSFQGVGAGQLIDRQRDRRFAVERAGLVVDQGAQFDAGDIAQADDALVGVGANDHVAELLRFIQPAQRAHRVLKVLPGGTGGWPICPAATCAFCCSMACTTSAVLILRMAICSGSSQMRML